MSEPLKKVNDRLFEEPYKDGKPFKWMRRARPLWLTLNNIQVRRVLRMEHSAVTLSDLLGDDEKPGKQAPDETYTESFTWQLMANGDVDGDRLGVIAKDGSRTNSYNHVDVTIRSAVEGDKGRGVLFLHDDEWTTGIPGRNERPCMEMPASSQVLEQLCLAILEGRVSKLQLGIRAELFNSEVDDALSEPWMPQTLYLDASHTFTPVYLTNLIASSPVHLPRSTKLDNGAPSAEEDKKERDAVPPHDALATLVPAVIRLLTSLRTIGIVLAVLLTLAIFRW